MTKQKQESGCLCCSGKPTNRCCKPILDGDEQAKTPVALMRSRYTAYALGGYGKYLINTWALNQRASLNEHALSELNTQWSRLEIMTKSQQGNEAYVEFKAYYLDEDLNEQVHHETSLFHRVNGHWYYVKAV